MRKRSVIRWIRLVISMAPLGLATSPIILTPQDARADVPTRAMIPANDSWDGYSEFLKLARAELGAPHVEPRAALDFDALGPEDALLITHPEVPLDEESIMRFLASGGRVLILDDFGTSATFLERFQIRRESFSIQNPRRFLGQNPALAVARPVVRQAEDGTWSRHPTTEGVREVVTNHAAALVHPELTTLLEVETTDGTKTLAATGVIEGKGRLVAVGDSSLFINLMLRYPGNRAFLSQVLRYLLERDGQSKPGKLYLVSGTFTQKGRFGQVTRREEIVQRLRSLQSELERLRKEGFGGPAAHVLAALLALFIASFELRQGRPNAQVRLPSFAADTRVHSSEALRAKTGPSGARDQEPAWVLVELREALELILMDRAAQPTPVLNAELDRILTVLPEDRRSPSKELIMMVRSCTEPAGQTPRKRLSEAEMASLSEATLTLLEELRPKGPRASLRPIEAS